MQKRLRAIARKFPDEVGRELYLMAEEILTTSKRNFAPVAPDGGALRSSGFVRPPTKTPGGLIEVAILYGGTSAPYAVAVHEHPSRFSPPSWKGKTLNFNVGGVKYLERPLMDAVPTLARDISRTIHLDKTAR